MRITKFLARYGIVLLRIGLGIIFFWFGALKFFPGLSPAQDLVTRTFDVITLGLVNGKIAILVLATWECVIGIGLIVGKWIRTIILLLLLQMCGAMLPIIFFPHEFFTYFPFAPTLQGQYILMNIVLVSAGLVIGATVRGGYIEAHNVVKYNVLCFYPSDHVYYGLQEDHHDRVAWNARAAGKNQPTNELVG